MAKRAASHGSCRVAIVLVAAWTLSGLPSASGAQQQNATRPLSKNDIIELIQHDVPTARVEVLAVKHGVSFEMTPEVVEDLRHAGADDELLRFLRELSEKTSKPSPPAESPKPLPPAPPVLQLETTPAGAEIYIDQERAGTTGPDGKLKISTLTPGAHQLRVSHEGYRDLQQKVELAAGQNTDLPLKLEAAPPPPAQSPSTTAPAQNPAANDGSLVIKSPSSMGGAAGPFAGAANDPNHKRFYVQHVHGHVATRHLAQPGMPFCYGYLLIGQGRVEYNANRESDTFDVAASDISGVQMKGNHLHMRVKDKNYHFVMMDASQSPDDLKSALDEATEKK